MNEEQYQALCKSCDRLLLAPDSGAERIAAPWLHVIRAHPIFLESYADIFGAQTGSNVSRRVRNIASALRSFFKSFTVDGPLWSCVGELPQKSDVLLVSHLVNESFPGQEGDFYYGKAAWELEGYGLSAAIALINYTEASSATLASKWRHAKIPRVIFERVLNFPAELRLYRRACSAADRLNSIADLQSSDLDRRVTARAAIEAASGGAVSALRLGDQIKALVARLQPRAIVVTYEGHSWERITFAAARAVSPGIRCIGYQHAVLFNLQHAVQRSLAHEFNPDVILTSGLVSQVSLQKNPDLKNVRIDTFGSNRSFARQPARSWRSITGEKRTCLVLPEGISSECNLLFSFSLECAQAMPNTEFIWRLHPNMDYRALVRINSAFRDLPPNVTLSASSLAEDFVRSHWALYRGSTAIVQAVMSGVCPVYLHQVGEIPLDTLYEIAELHARVIKPDDFKLLVKEARAPRVSAEAEQVQDYCEKMFTPMDTRMLAECISGKK